MEFILSASFARASSCPAAQAAEFMVAAANPHAARAGLEMLRAGGSALDAAIAVQLVLNLVEPQSSGIGGGAFILHWDEARRRVAGLRRPRDRAGGRAARTGSCGDGTPMPIGEAIDSAAARSACPALLRMLALAHGRTAGCPGRGSSSPRSASPRTASRSRRGCTADRGADPSCASNPAARAYFYIPDGSPLPVGTCSRNPRVRRGAAPDRRRGPGRVLRRDDGATTSWPRSCARDRHPGDLTRADLRPTKRWSARRSAAAIAATASAAWPPPTSGGIAVLQILGLLERFDHARMRPASSRRRTCSPRPDASPMPTATTTSPTPISCDVPEAGLIDPRLPAARAPG